MNIIQWDDSFCVRIDEIDRQHQKLVEIVNRLAESMAEGQGKKALGSIIEELIQYTLVHFKTEERIFKIVHYPETKEHTQEHEDFVQKVEEFKESFDKGQLGLTVGVMNFLCEWVRNHIKKSDKQYARFIDENGLRPA